MSDELQKRIELFLKVAVPENMFTIWEQDGTSHSVDANAHRREMARDSLMSLLYAYAEEEVKKGVK